MTFSNIEYEHSAKWPPGVLFNPGVLFVVSSATCRSSSFVHKKGQVHNGRHDKDTKQDLTNWSRKLDFYNFIKMCGECLTVDKGPQLSLEISVLFLITFEKYL